MADLRDGLEGMHTAIEALERAWNYAQAHWDASSRITFGHQMEEIDQSTHAILNEMDVMAQTIAQARQNIREP